MLLDYVERHYNEVDGWHIDILIDETGLLIVPCPTEEINDWWVATLIYFS